MYSLLFIFVIDWKLKCDVSRFSLVYVSVYVFLFTNYSALKMRFARHVVVRLGFQESAFWRAGKRESLERDWPS